METSSRSPAAIDRASLVEQCYGPVRVGLVAFCGDRELAEEATQEAMARLWLARDWVLDSNPAAWAFVVGTNLIRSRFRRRRLERRAQNAPTERAVRDIAETVITREALHAALRRLSSRQRQAVVLRYLLDATVDQTAVAMGCKPGTVKALTSQAVRALRHDLNTPIEEPEER